MAYRTRLFKTHDLLIKRPQEGYYQNLQYVEPDEPLEIPIKCNIQPYKYDQKRLILPQGVGAEWCIIVYSQDIDFKTTDQHGKTNADWFEHDGFEWECYLGQKWRGHGMSIQHSVCLAVRRDVDSDAEEVEGWPM